MYPCKQGTFLPWRELGLRKPSVTLLISQLVDFIGGVKRTFSSV
jgi:hypothetical protein